MSASPSSSPSWPPAGGRAVDNGQRGGLLIGPPSAGKTLFLRMLQKACSDRRQGEHEMRLRMDEAMARLASTKEENPVDATSHITRYSFGIEASRRKRDDKPGRYLGVRGFTFMDGPGGALIHEDPNDASEFAVLYREELIRAGRDASSLIFLLDATNSQSLVSFKRNLPILLSMLQVEVAAQGERTNGSLLSRFKQYAGVGEGFPPVAAGRITALNADRVVLVLNRMDQVAAQWVNSERARAPHSALESPLEFLYRANPLWVVREALGLRPLLAEIHANLRPDAELGIALCSAGGFFLNSGEPYRDSMGRLNTAADVPPEVLWDQLYLPGVRDAMLFAGWGEETGFVCKVGEPHLVRH